MSEGMREALERIQERTAEYVGCCCMRDDPEPGDCWPCRMQSIGADADEALAAYAAAQPAPGGVSAGMTDEAVEKVRNGLNYLIAHQCSAGEIRGYLESLVALLPETTAKRQEVDCG